VEAAVRFKIMFIISILGSFLGGMAALFAPCCVTILFPLYLGTIFKQTSRVLLMTAIFGLGIAAVLLPISLGVSFLAEFFHNYHREFYIFGGIMLLLVGLTLAFKIKMPMPRFKQPEISQQDGKIGLAGAFGLGIFSGIASACCAPVLAGSLTLAVISGTFLKAFIVSMFYVLGMVVPLFVLAFFWKKLKFSDLKIFEGGKLKIIAGVVFALVGIMIFYLGITGNQWWAPEWQVGFSDWLKNISQGVVNIFR
jgi:cytochrome c biogenesis protein CcdA